MEYRIICDNEEETKRLAENIEAEKFESMVICLIGDLGSGKTVFAKGFANALAVDEVITSPTFNIIKEYYSGELPLFHMDVYRIEKVDDELGLEEYFSKKGIVIIEWADLIKDILPEERLEIKFNVISEDKRVLVLKPFGKKYEELCEAIV